MADPRSRCNWLLCVLLLACSACSDDQRASLRTDADRMLIDSLAASGAHGYYVATYVVGRYKNTRLHVDPFAFTVSRMSPELEERPLTFQVLDPRAFTLSYELDGKQQVLMGGFESPLRTDEIEIEVKGLLKAGGDSALWWSNVAMGTYELLVFKY